MDVAIKTGWNVCPCQDRVGYVVADKTAGGGMGYMVLESWVGHGDGWQAPGG